jgi:hypothetical protein
MTIASQVQQLRGFSGGEEFREAAARILTELARKPVAGSATQANDLYALASQIQAAAVVVNAGAAAAVAAAPTIASRTQPVGVNIITVNFTGADLGGYALPAHWATNPVRTITGVRQTGVRQLQITYDGVSLVNTNTLAFDNPASPTLKSVYGVPVADAAAAAITVS